MKYSRVKGNFFAVGFMALLLVLSVPATSLAKDKHGRNWRDNSSWSKRDGKCRKFVNCHDASDGRWDKRGPRGDHVGNGVRRNRYRNRVSVNNNNWANRRRTVRYIRHND